MDYFSELLGNGVEWLVSHPMTTIILSVVLVLIVASLKFLNSKGQTQALDQSHHLANRAFLIIGVLVAIAVFIKGVEFYTKAPFAEAAANLFKYMVGR